MGCSSSKLKGESIPDLTSKDTPIHLTSLVEDNDSETRDAGAKGDLNSASPHTRSAHQAEVQNSTRPLKNTFTTDLAEPTTSNKPRKQSLKQRWKERRGVPEPKDENGRGIYTGKTTEELIRDARRQPVDGRDLAGNVS